MCLGREFVAKLEHLQVPLVARIVLEGRSSCLPFQTTEQPVAQMKVPIDTARGPVRRALLPLVGACQPRGGSLAAGSGVLGPIDGLRQPASPFAAHPCAYSQKKGR
jgi:hypothetical protein